MMETSQLKRWFSLILVITVLWGVMGYALPMLTDTFEATRQLASYIDESGIETGQFYYTGVEILNHAESGARGAVAFAEARKALLETKEKDRVETDTALDACE